MFSTHKPYIQFPERQRETFFPASSLRRRPSLWWPVPVISVLQRQEETRRSLVYIVRSSLMKDRQRLRGEEILFQKQAKKVQSNKEKKQTLKFFTICNKLDP